MLALKWRLKLHVCNLENLFEFVFILRCMWPELEIHTENPSGGVKQRMTLLISVTPLLRVKIIRYSI